MRLITNIVRRSDSPQRLLLLIHGKGSDEYDLEPLVSYLDPDGRFLAVLPRAPLAFPPGFYWYETQGIPKGGAEFVSSVDALDDLLDEACATHGLERSQAVVGGFSQGAGLSLALGLRRSDRPHPAGLLAMSGFLCESDEIDYDFASADGQGGTPGPPAVLIQHGTQDPLVDISWGRTAARTLAVNGVPVVYREYPMGHEVALEGLADAAAWLSRVLAGERPAEPPPDEVEAPAPTSPEDALIRSVRTADFEREVLQSELPVIVDFWAPWCQPCHQLAPVVEQVAAMRQGAYRVVKVNIDEEPSLAQTFGVQSIPMVALFRDGRMERTSIGVKSRPELEAALGMLVIP